MNPPALLPRATRLALRQDIEMLRNEGIRVREDETYMYALHKAAYIGNNDVVKILLKKRADQEEQHEDT